MRMLEVVTLRSTETTSDAKGKPVKTTTDVSVYAEPKGVKRSEFYQAQAVGMNVDAVFELNADEYGGQKDLVYNGKAYQVTREYPLNLRRIELVCRKVKE